MGVVDENEVVERPKLGARASTLWCFPRYLQMPAVDLDL